MPRLPQRPLGLLFNMTGKLWRAILKRVSNAILLLCLASEGVRAIVTLPQSQASTDTTSHFPTVRPGPLGPLPCCLAAFFKAWPGQPHPAFSPHPAILATQKFLPHPACSRKVNKASKEGLYCVLALLAVALEAPHGPLTYKLGRSLNSE